MKHSLKMKPPPPPVQEKDKPAGPRACAPAPADTPKFHQGKISPPSLKTTFSHEIIPQQSPPPPPLCVSGAGLGKLLVAVVKQGLQMDRCVHSGCGGLSLCNKRHLLSASSCYSGAQNMDGLMKGKHAQKNFGAVGAMAPTPLSLRTGGGGGLGGVAYKDWARPPPTVGGAGGEGIY